MIQAWIPLRIERKWREATDIYSFELVDPEGLDLPPSPQGPILMLRPPPALCVNIPSAMRMITVTAIRSVSFESRCHEGVRGG